MPEKSAPERSCAATGAKGPPTQFLRFVQGPKDEKGQSAPWPDLAGKEAKLPGRGLYLTPTLAAYGLALKKKVFAHHLETNQPPPPFETLAELLEKDALQRLSLARKAGQLVPGVDNILEMAPQNVLKGLIQATNAGADAQEKISRLATRLNLPLLSFAAREQLSRALGQSNVTTLGLLRLDTVWPAVHKAHQAFASLSLAKKHP